MASKNAFRAMETSDWKAVKEIVAAASLAKDLEQKHGYWEVTLLIKAARNGKEDVVFLLLNAGAVIDAKDKGGSAALHWAAHYGHIKTVEILLVRGADIDIRDKGGRTPLMKAAYNGQYGLADFNVHSGDEGRLQAAQMLLDRGADFDAKDKDGMTALIVAAYYGRSEVVAQLIDRGANINAQNNWGYSVLILAAYGVRVAAVKLLCGKGVDLTLQDNDGYDALYYAELHLGFSGRREDAKEIIAVIQEETEWRRVKNYVIFLHTVGLSAADWSVRGGGSVPVTDGTTTATNPDISSSGFTRSSSMRKVLENRDLCRIVTSYIIPKKHTNLDSVKDNCYAKDGWWRLNLNLLEVFMNIWNLIFLGGWSRLKLY